jgi:beta-phosphoglucomutase-like phosphatase (HAD superfamily)
MPQKLDRVIFDCDGALVDSESIASRIFRECLAELGIAALFGGS